MISDPDKISDSLSDLGARLRRQPSVQDRVVQQIAATDGCQTAISPAWYRGARAKAAVSLAACLVVALAVWSVTNGDGASQAFAAALDGVRKARTFSCKEIVEHTRDGKKHVTEQLRMFKEPDLERHAWLAGVDLLDTTITHYGKRQELHLHPADKTATLYDKSSDYVVNADTGKLELTRLDTSMRDSLLKLRAGAVKDLGDVELDGRSVRMLQSQKGDRVTTVWADPRSGLPVQIELRWPDQRRASIRYASIQIDVELDDSLFSLEPPEGYRLQRRGTGWPDHKKKLEAKMRFLIMPCAMYATRHDGEFPGALADLKEVGVKKEMLKVVLAAPGQPEGPPVIRYHGAPRLGAEAETQVVLYEAYEQRRHSGESQLDDGVVAMFADGHGELMPVQVFEQFLKPWPEARRKLSINMAYLHWSCVRFAERHGGQFPEELSVLAGQDFPARVLERLVAAPGEPDGPVVVRYRQPRANADKSTEIMLYEARDRWPDGGVTVCFWDGHCEVIADQRRFEELMQ